MGSKEGFLEYIAASAGVAENVVNVNDGNGM
jgi:hypothetical protein